MSYGFGTTLGTAATDRIQLSVTPTTGVRTYAFVGAINGPGGGTNGLGRFLDAEPNTSNTEAWFREASSNRIIYNRAHTSVNGAWSCPVQSNVSAEHTYGISVDGGGTASPTMYFDGVSQTVTVGAAPSGSATDNTAPIFLGNRSPDFGRGYDGTQRRWAIWNSILSAQEHLDFHNGADPRYDAGWTSGTRPANLVFYGPFETGTANDQGVTVTVTGAKLIAASQSATVTLTGQAYSVSQGSMTPTVGSNVSVTLTGQSYSITAGTITPSLATTTLTSPVDRGNISLSESSITNATSATPTVTMMPRRWVNEQKTNSGTADNVAKSYFFYGATPGVANKTPLYKMKFWSSSSHSEATELFKWHYVTPLDATYRPVWSYDARNWNYFDNCAWNADGLYLDFYNNAAFTSDTVYFASAFPWQTDKTAEWITSLIALNSPYLTQPASALAYGGDPYQIGLTTARQNELGETIAACKVYALRVSSGGLDPNGHPKREIVCCAGTHAGEDLGNWCLKGALEFLLSSDTKAVLARQWCNFTFYPMNDSSGRRGGHRRSHFDPALLTADGNRYWGLNTLAETNQIVAAIMADTGGSFAASFDFHAGHATPAYYDVQSQTSNDTWHAAIQTYIPSIVRYVGDIANSMMGWAENTIGAKIAVTPEYNSDTTHTIAEVEANGAAYMKAIADVAATNYLYSASQSISLAGQTVSVSQGVLQASVSKGISGQSISIGTGAVAQNIAVTLAGQSYGISAGSVTRDVSITVSGKANSPSAGVISNSRSVGLAGQSYAVTLGVISTTVSAGNNVSIALTGQNYAISQGLVGKSVAVGLQGDYVSFSQGTMNASSQASDYFITLAGQTYLHNQGSFGVSVSYSQQQPAGTVTLSQESIDALATAIANAIYTHPNAITETGIATSVWSKVL